MVESTHPRLVCGWVSGGALSLSESPLVEIEPSLPDGCVLCGADAMLVFIARADDVSPVLHPPQTPSRQTWQASGNA